MTNEQEREALLRLQARCRRAGILKPRVVETPQGRYALVLPGLGVIIALTGGHPIRFAFSPDGIDFVGYPGDILDFLTPGEVA